MKRLNVRIGRPPDAGPRHGVGVESSPAPESDDPAIVQIDLGPSKLVSRSHAELYFDHDSLTWQVVVNGRNGVKINDICLRRGQQRRVNSGDVLEIAGNQMMFVAAEGQAVIHPMFLQKLREEIILADPESRNNDNHRQAEPDALAQNGNLFDTQSQTGTRPRVNGQAAIAPAPPDFVRPTTPTHSPKKSGKPGSGVKHSPAYGRGIVMESNEQIDYQSDSARDLKPTLSYASMITQAIMSMEGEVLSLDGIYKWIMAHYSYYRHVQSNWQV